MVAPSQTLLPELHAMEQAPLPLQSSCKDWQALLPLHSTLHAYWAGQFNASPEHALWPSHMTLQGIPAGHSMVAAHCPFEQSITQASMLLALHGEVNVNVVEGENCVGAGQSPDV
jgi:hypothetical protein